MLAEIGRDVAYAKAAVGIAIIGVGFRFTGEMGCVEAVPLGMFPVNRRGVVVWMGVQREQEIVVGLHEIGLEFEGLPIGFDGLVQLIAFLEKISQVGVRAGEIGAQPQSDSVLLDRLLGLASGLKAQAKVVMGIGVGGIERDRFFQRVDGVLRLAERGVGHAEKIVSLGSIGGELKRFVKSFQRLRQLSPMAQLLAGLLEKSDEIESGVAMIGLEFQRGGKRLLCRGRISGLRQGDAQIGKDVGGFGAMRRRLAEERQRFARPPRLRKQDAQEMQGVDLIGNPRQD